MGLTNADFALLFRKAAATDESTEQRHGSPDEGDDRPDSEMMNPMMQAAMRVNFRDEETWDEDEPRAMGLGNVPPREATPELPHGHQLKGDEDERKRVLSEAELRRKFTWGKHTTGFGVKMLAKMGFSGRLGKDEQGVSATVEVVQRPNQMGLGFGSFKEAGNLKHNKRLEKELKGETFDEKEEREREQRECDALEEDDSLWRKRKVVSAKRVHKRAADVTNEAHAKKPRNETILDMRGPDIRVLDNLSEVYAEQEASAPPKLGEELVYNVRMVVNLAQGRIYDLTQKIDGNVETLESMTKEAKILKAQVETDTLRWTHVEELLMKMAALETVVANTVESLSIDHVVDGLRKLRGEFPGEFEAYKLVQITPSLTIPPLKALVLSSDMLNRDSLLFALKQLQQLQLFLFERWESPQDNRTSYGVFHHIHEKHSSLGDDIYNYILEEALWPGVVQTVNVDWNLANDPDACARWYDAFKPHLPEEFSAAFLHQLILPRLKKEFQRWSLKTHPTMMHTWWEVWQPHFDSGLKALIPDIQLSLGSELTRWHPSDQSMISVITPWRQIWGEIEYGKFTHRHVISKLVRCLQREFEINPQNQSLDALRWVLVWQPHIAERQFVALFEGEFFPRWLKVLHQWVSTSPQLAELETWYLGWKKFFAKHQLATKPRLVTHFHGAVLLLEAALMKELDRSHHIPALNRYAPSGYQEALVKVKASLDVEDEEATTKAQPSVKPRKPSHSVNLKDLVEHLAIENDLDFMPKGSHDGQQVYLFGKHHILIEQGVVFVEKARGEFQPVDIQELLH